MKIKRLEIHDIASIPHAEIDFMGDVLGNEPLFLINGTTGAGKTTILDAICLALYGDTPRFADVGEKGERFVDTYKARARDAERKTKEININHKGQLLRRGAGEAWACLTFEADGEDYLARWGVARANRRPDGAMQTPENTLEQLSTHYLWKKKKEAVAKVEELVGLSFDEFCRTTMLAQGEFARFLQCKTDEKSAILEMLTHTTVYSRLGSKIYQLCKEHEEQLLVAEAKLSNIQPFTEEQIAERQGEISRLNQQMRLLDDELKTLVAGRDWLLRDAQLMTSEKERLATLDAMKARLASEDYLKEKDLVADYRLTAQPRSWLDDIAKAQQARQRLEEERTVIAQTFQRLTEGEERMKVAQRADKLALDEARQWLAACEADAPMLTDAPAIVVALRQVMAEEEDVRRKTVSVENIRLQLPTCRAEVEKAVKAEQEAEACLERCKKVVVEREAERERLNPTGLEQQLEELNIRQRDLTAAGASLDLLVERQANLAKAEKAADDIKVERENWRATLPERERALAEASDWLEKANIVYEQWHHSLDDSYKLVRASLRQGDTCPLCRQRVAHDHVPDPDYEQVLRPIIDRKKECERNRQDANAALQTCNRMIQDREKQLAKALKTAEKAMADFKGQWEKFGRLFGGIALAFPSSPIADEAVAALDSTAYEDLPVENWRECLKDWSAVVGEQLSKVLDKRKEVILVDEELKALREAVAKAQKQCTLAQKTTQKVRQENENLLLQQQNLATQIVEHGAKVDKVLQLMDRRVSYADWRQQWADNHEAFIARLKEDAKAYADKVKEEERLAKAVDNRSLSLDNVEVSRREVERQADFLTSMPPTVVQELVPTAKVPALWQQLAAKVSAWRANRDNVVKDEKERSQLLEDFLTCHPHVSLVRLRELAAVNPQIVQNIEAEQRKWEDDLQRAEGEYANLKRELQLHRGRRPQMDEGDTAESLGERLAVRSAERDEITTQMGQLKAQLDDNEKTVRLHQSAIAERDSLKRVRDRWKAFSDVFGSADGKKFRNIAQSFILRHLLQRANYFLSQFTDRFRLTCQPGSITILVDDKYSNQSPQYIKVLSGGETFMVSLSLALALAQLNPNKSDVDIIFIDEGFGTLDEGCLNAVMDTLERLHQMGGRRVGVISHVEALNERILTQIQVSRIDPSRSQVKVVRA